MDPYLILGVAENATLDEIRKAYRRLAIQLHPDAGGNLEDFKRLQAAYEEICRRAAEKSAASPGHGRSRTGEVQPEEPLDVEIFDEAAPEPHSSKRQEVEQPAKARPTRVVYSKKWPMFARIMAAACIGISLIAYLVWPTVRLELAIQQGRWSEAVRLAPQNQRALLGHIRALLEDPECNFDELNSRLNDLEKLSARNVPLAELQRKAWVRQGLAHIRAGKVNEAIPILQKLMDDASSDEGVGELRRSIVDALTTEIERSIREGSTTSAFQKWSEYMKRLSDINFALISTHRLLANALQLRCEDLARNGKFEELESAQNQLTIVSKALGETLGPEYAAMQKLCRAIRHAAQDEIDAAILSFGQASVEESVARLRETAKQQIVRAITYRVDKAIQRGNTTLASQEIERATQWDPEIKIPNRLLLLPLEDAFAKFKRQATPTSSDEFQKWLSMLPEWMRTHERAIELKTEFESELARRRLTQPVERKDFRECIKELEELAASGASLEARAEVRQEALISIETYARHLAECGRYDRIAKLYEELESLPEEDRKDIETSLLSTPVMVNSLGMEFLLMPHLRFKEKVPIFFGVYEVTGEQYSTITGSDPSKYKGRALPVTQVTLDDAKEFCKRLSALPLEKRLGRVYRLPENLEWETASRAGAKTKLYFGDNASRSANFAWLSGNAKKSPRAVGRLQKNAWGLYDMIGNVSELDDEGDMHGWSYKTPSRHQIPASWMKEMEGYKASDVGFRVVVNVSPLVAVLKVTGPSSDAAQTWRYQFTPPPNEWTRPEFNDRNWPKAPAGFGDRENSKSNRRIRPHTEWTSEGIWLRTTFHLDAAPELAKFVIAHPDELNILLNGIPVLTRSENSEGKYTEVNLTQSEMQGLVVGENSIAVSARHKAGPRYLDVGLIVEY